MLTSNKPENVKVVLFLDGTWKMLPVQVTLMAALVGQPTAFVEQGQTFAWVKPLNEGVYTEVA